MILPSPSLSTLLSIFGLLLSWPACGQDPVSPSNKAIKTPRNAPATDARTNHAPTTPRAIATFAGGCFWCSEAILERVEGVLDVQSGYMGGHLENPTHEQVSRKDTGHVEVVRVTFDPVRIPYEELLDVFWQSHDPTSWDRQGDDRGPQYRSVIFTHGPEQKELAEQSKRSLDKSGRYSDPLVTEIRAADVFWPAEDKHQDFYRNNPDYGYCRAVISPKMKKFGFE